MGFQICGAVNPDDKRDVCDFRMGHPKLLDDDGRQHDHAMRIAGEVAVYFSGDGRKSGLRPDVDVLIGNIASGACDPYLEAILAAAHGRKRALRSAIRPYGLVTDG